MYEDVKFLSLQDFFFLLVYICPEDNVHSLYSSAPLSLNYYILNIGKYLKKESVCMHRVGQKKNVRKEKKIDKTFH